MKELDFTKPKKLTVAKKKIKLFNAESESCENHYWEFVPELKARVSKCKLIEDACRYKQCPKVKKVN